MRRPSPTATNSSGFTDTTSFKKYVVEDILTAMTNDDAAEEGAVGVR